MLSDWNVHILLPFRRQELRELRLLQKEEHRNQTQLSSKHELQLEQMHKRFEQEINVSVRKDGSPEGFLPPYFL